MLVKPSIVAGQVDPGRLAQCLEVGFSLEEDFVTQGPEPFDGNPIISDGDLLGPSGALCARNAELMSGFDIPAAFDLGLDAADVITASANLSLVAFSTELDSPNTGQFTSGDLLATNNAVILNQALTANWNVGYDLGLDAVHFVGDRTEIRRFLEAAAGQSPVGAATLSEFFETYSTVDIWFSTEGTFGSLANPTFLDGDLLSARTGTIVAANIDLLDASVPAGIPNKGVDFGLDAATTDRAASRERIHYSTEILYEDEISFTDGDVLRFGDGVVATNWDLIAPFEPKSDMLGLDALTVNLPPDPDVCVSRITKIGGVDVADFNPSTGMVKPLAVGSVNEPRPIGGRIPLEGQICDDVERFRVVYREAGSSDPWAPIDVPGPRGWHVKVDALIPVGPDCLGSKTWSSPSSGWFNAAEYRQLSRPALAGCNPGLALTVWESASAVAGSEARYELILEAETASGIISDTTRIVQLDNQAPTANLDKQYGTCDEFTEADMPLMVTGRISDTHFHQYRLRISGDSYGVHNYSPVALYDDPTDNIIDTGTLNWNMFVNLHEVDVDDLDPDPIDCGYTVHLTAWDLTIVSGFHYGANLSTRCIGCRHTNDYWTFEYTP
jgi:hypothetical protein